MIDKKGNIESMQKSISKHHRPVLVTGATGYVGGRLIPRLLAMGYTVRAFGRSISKMACRPWAAHDNIELVKGDVLDEDRLTEAAQGCSAAFYLVHAMIARDKDFAEADRQSAHNMKRAAERAGLKQVIYLGGLGEIGHPKLTHHLASRHEVGDILRSGKVPVTVLRAAMIIGSGSASFEILRYLVSHLPIMITPRWVRTPTQPIAIENVLGYLTGCLENDATRGKTFDIGGPDIVTYRDLIQLFTEAAGLSKRIIIPVPVLTPKLSALWIHLVTPVPSAIALPLTEGLSLPTICTENRIQALVKQKLLTCREAIRISLERILEAQVETCWSDAGSLRPPEWAACGDAQYAGGTILNCAYRKGLDLPPEKVWPHIAELGGDAGYYFGDRLWRIRGAIDRLLGGVGMRRGRRHPTHLATGDALDFWRVLHFEPMHRLTLVAEMKVPGEALLDLQVVRRGEGHCELRLISRFLPRGLAGIVYWYPLYPFHVWIFRGMLAAIAARAGAVKSEPAQRFDPHVDQVCALPFTEK